LTQITYMFFWWLKYLLFSQTNFLNFYFFQVFWGWSKLAVFTAWGFWRQFGRRGGWSLGIQVSYSSEQINFKKVDRYLRRTNFEFYGWDKLQNIWGPLWCSLGTPPDCLFQSLSSNIKFVVNFEVCYLKLIFFFFVWSKKTTQKLYIVD